MNFVCLLIMGQSRGLLKSKEVIVKDNLIQKIIIESNSMLRLDGFDKTNGYDQDFKWLPEAMIFEKI